jgi:hypothetical protein
MLSLSSGMADVLAAGVIRRATSWIRFLIVGN